MMKLHVKCVSTDAWLLLALALPLLIVPSAVAAQPVLIDGGELYGFESVPQFQGWYNFRKYDIVFPGSPIPRFISPTLRARWPELCTVDYGVFVDCFLPHDIDGFTTALSNALKHSDSLVWLYSEKIQFLYPSSDPDGAPQEWVEAVRKARQLAGSAPAKLILCNGRSRIGDHYANDPGFVAANFSFLDSLPFDGMLVSVEDSTQPYPDTVTYNALGIRPISYATIQSQLAPLVGLRPKNLRTNFAEILMLKAPDMFADWTVPLHNCANLAHAVKAAGLRGIVVDNEDYSSGWSKYPGVSSKPGLSQAVYENQAFLRGRQMASTIFAEFPDCQLMNMVPPTFSLSHSKDSINYELMGAFFAGMVQATADAKDAAQFPPVIPAKHHRFRHFFTTSMELSGTE